jgi:hypothetical protein
MIKVGIFSINEKPKPGHLCVEELGSHNWYPPEDRENRIYRKMALKAIEVYNEEMKKTDEEWEEEVRLEKECFIKGKQEKGLSNLFG